MTSSEGTAKKIVPFSSEERTKVKALLDGSNKHLEELAQVVIKTLGLKGSVNKIETTLQPHSGTVNANAVVIVKVCFHMSDGSCGCVTENSCEPCT
jgi:hypothetical protein